MIQCQNKLVFLGLFLAAEIMFPICILEGFYFLFFLKLHKPIDALNNNCTLCRFFFRDQIQLLRRRTGLYSLPCEWNFVFQHKLNAAQKAEENFIEICPICDKSIWVHREFLVQYTKWVSKYHFFKGSFYPTIKCICESFNKGHCFVIVWNDYMFSGGKDPASVKAAAH